MTKETKPVKRISQEQVMNDLEDTKNNMRDFTIDKKNRRILVFRCTYVQHRGVPN